MNTAQLLKTLFEIALVALALYAVFNENKFIAFEDRIKAAVRRRRLRVLSENRVASTTYPRYN